MDNAADRPVKVTRTCALALALGLLAIAGCGREGDVALPPACRGGEAAVREALEAAPGEVRIQGTPISRCVGDESDASDLQDVGAAYLNTAASLSTPAARDPEGPEATQLGYLMGAVRRSAPADHGVNYELVRRLEQELLRVDTTSEAFRRGERAGREGG